MRTLLVMVLLTGCTHSAVVVSNARPVAPSSNVNSSGAVAAAVLITTVAVAASQSGSTPPPSAPSSSMSSAWISQPVPAMAPEREIGVQDCTKPVDLTAGNLRCR